LLLEDLGDDTYTRVLAKVPQAQLKETELNLYTKACDCLLKLHKTEIPAGLQSYNHALLFRGVMAFVDWYLPLHKKSMSIEQKADFKFLWFELFDLLSKKEENISIALRDYHADNLMVLPERKNHEQVGLLDFQDALTSSKAYDLVSLLEDARRDLNRENRQKLFEYYLKKAACDHEDFIKDYAILSLQRNIRILGVFARLSVRDGKHNYLNFIPRVLGFVEERISLRDPTLFEIGKFLKTFL
jgi:aminoglycoside/choline kinase family phosphotransferase